MLSKRIKTYQNVLFLILFFIFSNGLYAQEKGDENLLDDCPSPTHELLQKYYEDQPETQKFITEYKKNLKAAQQSGGGFIMNKRIPLFFTLSSNSLSLNVNAAINFLNSKYANANITFYNAGVVRIDNSSLAVNNQWEFYNTSGVIGEYRYQSHFNEDLLSILESNFRSREYNYAGPVINVSAFDGANISSFPEFTINQDYYHHNNMLNLPILSRRYFSHEMGHNLSLLHTFQGSGTLANNWYKNMNGIITFVPNSTLSNIVYGSSPPSTTYDGNPELKIRFYNSSKTYKYPNHSAPKFGGDLLGDTPACFLTRNCTNNSTYNKVLCG